MISDMPFSTSGKGGTAWASISAQTCFAARGIIASPLCCIGFGLEEDLAVQEAGGAEAWWLRSAGEWGPSEQLLACGAAAMSDLRAAVRDELGYSCSAGGWLLTELGH